MRVNDAVSGGVLVAAGGAVVAVAATFPDMPGQAYGPALFPSIVGVGLALCGAWLIVQGWRRRETEPWFAGAPWLRSRRHVGNALAVVGGLIGYVVLAEPLGFVPTAFLLLTGLLAQLRGGRWPSSALIAALATWLVYEAFTRFLLVPLPLGVLERVLY